MIENPKEVMYESKLRPNVFLAINEHGSFLIRIEGNGLALMSVDAWTNLLNMVADTPKTKDEYLMDHFGAVIERKDDNA
jgi:hypothetical protein